MIEAQGPLARIVERLSPPTTPVHGRGDWTLAERELGTRLPDDFKQLVQTYGLGDFWGRVILRTPFGDNNPVRLDATFLDDFESARELWPEQYPYPFFPEPGGLLAWAVTESGTSLCWLTDGQPDAWPVVIWSRDDAYERFDCGAAEFLEGWISGRIISALLGGDPDLAPWFDRAVDRDHVYVGLGEGDLPYDETLRILRETLTPTADRGSYEHDGSRQDKFVASETGWQLTYETGSGSGHQLRVAFPPADSERARRAVLTAVERMGCSIRSLDTIHGTSSWGEPGLL